MFKRLFVLVLLALATASVSTPAHASTLTVHWVECLSYTVYNTVRYQCNTHVTGGTGSYVSYTWFVDSSFSGWDYTAVTTTNYYEGTCYYGPPHERYRVVLTVQDSSGATASRSSLSNTCYHTGS